MKTVTLITLAVGVPFLLACSSKPPKPDSPQGEIRPANVSAQAVEDLLEIVKASRPTRFRAERGVSVQEVLQHWSQIARLKLEWQVKGEVPLTTGEVDELDIRSAVQTLASQFRSEVATVIVQFPTARTLLASPAVANSDGCVAIPAGAIALGNFCLEKKVPLFVLGAAPAKESLRQSLQRWANVAGLKLRWLGGRDWPIELEVAKPYPGDLLTSLNLLMKDLAAEGVNLSFVIRNDELVIDKKR